MLSSSDPSPRVTQPLVSEDGGDVETATAPTIFQKKSGELPSWQPSLPITSMKLPTVIPASIKKEHGLPRVPPLQGHHPFVLPGVLLGSLLLFILASLFVIPLDNSQHSRTIAQTLGDLISTGQFSAINTFQ